MEALGTILILVYVYAGDKANYYLKYHLLNVEAEYYGNTGNYLLSRFIWAAILGWATIPLAILHYAYKGADEQQKKYIVGGVIAAVACGAIFLSFTEKKTAISSHSSHVVSTSQQQNRRDSQENSTYSSNQNTSENIKIDRENRGHEFYVGNYNDGAAVYVLTETVKGKNYSDSVHYFCRVRADSDYLDYEFWAGASPSATWYYKNSEGYSGEVYGGDSPVAAAICNYIQGR